MDNVQYIVTLDKNEWKIFHHGRYYGPYANESAAIKSAIDAGDKAGRDGRDAIVMVQNDDRTFRTEWKYGAEVQPVAG